MPALQRSTRRTLFYALAFLFLAIVPFMLLYSQGYVLDLASLRSPRLLPTGGVFVKTVQPGVKVFIDEAYKRETAFISRGALITGLEPRRYTIRAEKEGYQQWAKIVRVPDESVLEFRNVYLPPATVAARSVYTLRQSVAGAVVALDGRPEVGLEVGEPSQPRTLVVLDPSTGRTTGQIHRVSRWSWDGRTRTFLIGRSRDGRMRWYRATLGPAGSAIEQPIAFRGLPAGFSTELLTPHPERSGELYFFAGGVLFLQGRSSVPVPIAEQIHAYAVTPERIYFVSKTGFFVESDLDGQNAKILGRKGLVFGEGEPVSIIPSPAGDIAIIDAAGGLFLYQPGRDTELGFIAGNVAGIDFSAEGDRMLFWEHSRLSIYWLRDNPRQPFDLARTRKFVFTASDPIVSARLNAEGTYAFYATAKGMRMVETDDRGGTNSYDLVRSPIQSFILDTSSLTLAWISGSVLYRASLKE